MHLYPIDGAVHRVGRRRNGLERARRHLVDGDRGDRARIRSKAEALKSWGRAYWKAVHPFNMDGAYVNFMMDDEADGRVQATYGANYQRLAADQEEIRPENLFRVNQNIRPAA